MTDSVQIAENLQRIRAQIATAAEASGRRADDVTLVAVTKYVGPAEIEALRAAGCRDLGESRPQALWEKAAGVDDPEVRWHLIGHLQRNKARRTLPLVSLVHSADSPRILQTMDEISRELDRRTDVLLEVNISADASKHGFAPAALEPLLPTLGEYANLRVLGLMAMAAREGGLDAAQQNFSQMRELRDRLQRNCPTEVSLAQLSMGMSGDFEVAIREGATIVRIGSALFR